MMNLLNQLRYKLKKTFNFKTRDQSDSNQRKDQNLEARRMDEELRFYQKEHPIETSERTIREVGGQDITAI